MNGRSLRLCALLIALADILFICRYLLGGYAGYDGYDHIFGRDFLNIYFAGHLLTTGQTDILFDFAAYNDALQAWLGSVYPPHFWSYSPSMLVIALGLGQLPYNVALLIWHGAGMLALIFAMRCLDLSRAWQAAVLFSPPATANLLAGQNGLFTAALLVLALVCSHARKAGPASLAWTALTFKPHLGLMALPLLLKARRFRIILLTGLLTLLMIIASGLLFGFGGWYKYVTYTAALQRDVMEAWAGFGLVLMPTWFMQGRILDWPVPLCYALQIAMTVPAVWLLWRSAPGQASDARAWLTWSVLGLYCLLPYYFIYDLVAFAVMLALWAREPEQLFDLPDASLARGCWLLFWLLAYMTVFSVYYSQMHIAPFLMLWLLWRYARHVRGQSGTPDRNPAPAGTMAGTAQEPA